MTESKWFINGHEGEKLPLNDRGLAYGDGLFETMRAIGPNIPLQSLHKQRLISGCKRLGIALDLSGLMEQLDHVLQQLDSAQSVIKIIVTRAGLSSGYIPLAQAEQANIYIRSSSLEATDTMEPVLDARLCDIRLSKQPALAGIKHLNRLEQVLAAKEINNPAMEGILLDTEGYVIEALSSNLIAVVDETLYIPDLGCSGVQGVMQACIENLASKEWFEIKTARMKIDEFIQASEILVCNSVRGIRNINSIEGLWQSPTEIKSETRSEIKSEPKSEIESNKAGSYLRKLLLDKLDSQFYSY